MSFSPLAGIPAIRDRKEEKEKEKKEKKDKDKVAAVPVGPATFALVCAAVFGPPVLDALHLAHDPLVIFWAGNFGYVAVLVPIMLAVSYVFHLRTGKITLITVASSTILPAGILVIVGNIYSSTVHLRGSTLLSTDCTTLPEKLAVQTAWSIASDLYETCMQNTAVDQQITVEEAYTMFRLQDCNVYTVVPEGDMYGQHRAIWKYLQALEVTQRCSGWCYDNRPLWSFTEVQDTCSKVAGQYIDDVVRPIASRMASYSMLVALVCTAGIVWEVMTSQALLRKATQKVAKGHGLHHGP